MDEPDSRSELRVVHVAAGIERAAAQGDHLLAMNVTTRSPFVQRVAAIFHGDERSP